MVLAVTLGVTILVVFMVHGAVRRLKKNSLFSLMVAMILFGWLLVVVVLGPTRFFAINPLVAPNIILGFLLLFILLKKAYSSHFIQTIADAIPQHWIIGLQIYRIVGISFFNLYNAGVLPAAFALSAGYGDIFVGVTAPFVAYAYFKKTFFARKLAIAWNCVGILDLVVAISIGIFGFPRPLQVLPLTPSTEPLALYPLVVIPLFAVPLALILHIVSLRFLLKKVG